MVQDGDSLLTWAVHQHANQIVEIARLEFEVLILSFDGNHGRSIRIRRPGTFRLLGDAYRAHWALAIALYNEVSL